MDKAEATADVQQRQDENTAALVMNTFYKVASEGSATVEDITKYLLDKFGDVWQVMKIHFPNLGIYRLSWQDRPTENTNPLAWVFESNY